MKKGRNRGWTLMEAYFLFARNLFLSSGFYLRPSAVRIFEAETRRRGEAEMDGGKEKGK
jgi:hypothetical protein